MTAMTSITAFEITDFVKFRTKPTLIIIKVFIPFHRSIERIKKSGVMLSNYLLFPVDVDKCHPAVPGLSLLCCI